MHRRSFIKKSALLSSGLFVADAAVAKFSLNREKVINIAMIGCGDRGKGVLSVIKSMPAKFNIAAYCDVLDFRLEETKKFAPQSAKSVKNYKQILDDKNVEAVFIATPLSAHFQIAKDAVLAANMFM